MPTNIPSQRVTAGALTGAAVTLLVLFLNTYVPFFKVKENHIHGEISGAGTTVFTFLVAYLVPPGRGEAILVDENGVARLARSD